MIPSPRSNCLYSYDQYICSVASIYLTKVNQPVALSKALSASVYTTVQLHTTVVIHSESPFASVAQQWSGQASADKAGRRQRPNSLFYTLWLTTKGQLISKQNSPTITFANKTNETHSG